MVNLLVVESPAKCKKIAGFLGQGWIVLATMGHIRALEESLDAVGLERDFEPRFRFLKEKAKAMKPIMDAAEKASEIYLAADDDREGEAIAYSVACLLKRDPASLPRSVFHEITETAIKAAVQNPRRIDMNVVYAQQARSVLDMLVGFTISPLLWKHVARSLSAGRCQTPALRLVSDREKEISNHSSMTTWKLAGEFSSSTIPFTSSMEDELEDQESALNYLENVHGDKRATIDTVIQKPWTANPPKPLITSTLQQEASSLYKINPKSAMKIAQELYEAGHITYMRTDHAILSEEAVKEAQNIVLKEHGAEYVGPTAKQAVPKKKGSAAASAAPAKQTQEAHEAIRPTHFDLKELPMMEDWTANHRKVYTLIHRRALQSVMSQARGQTRTAHITLDADEAKFPWSSSWRMTEFAGWQILGKPAQHDDDANADEESEDAVIWKKALELTEGTRLTWKTLTASPKRSKAASRFTEATLIRELEQRGIGRPSTFASLVEVLFDKLYVEKNDIAGTTIQNTTLSVKPGEWPPAATTTQMTLGAEKQKLVPTALGDSVVQFCTKEFPQLFAYEFTAKMEERLDNVSKGREQWKALCRDTWDSYKADHQRLSASSSVPSSSEKVKDFGGGFKAVMSKTGPLLVQESSDEATKPTFYSFPPNETVQGITEEVAREWIKKQKEDANMGFYNGKPIVKKKGPYGMYLQMGELMIPYVDTDTPEAIQEKFRAKTESAAAKYVFGPYTFSRGQYGPYMYKHDLKTKVFISIKDTIDPKTLTAEEAHALYKAGVEAKKAGGSRGGFRGRGGRGRGGRGGRGGAH
jgi:DNA topoisomerase-1